MRRSLALIFASLPMLAATVATAEKPQACIAEGMEGFRYYTPEDTANGVEQYRPIQFNRGSRDYILETYSGTAPAPKRPSEYCLRYEVGNLGDFDVHKLWWEAARLHAARLTAKDGEDNVKVRVDIQPSEPAPRAYRGDIHAFENEQAETVAYRPLTVSPEEHASAAEAMPRLSPTWLTPDQLAPELAYILEAVGFENPERVIK